MTVHQIVPAAVAWSRLEISLTRCLGLMASLARDDSDENLSAIADHFETELPLILDAWARLVSHAGALDAIRTAVAPEGGV